MYRIIEAEKANFTIVRMTGLLEVSRSGFYKWRTARAAGPTPAQQRREAIDVKVKGFHDASDQVYGAPRILADLREDGEVISRKTVAASMRRQRLAGISPRIPPPSSERIRIVPAIAAAGAIGLVTCTTSILISPHLPTRRLCVTHHLSLWVPTVRRSGNLSQEWESSTTSSRILAARSALRPTRQKATAPWGAVAFVRPIPRGIRRHSDVDAGQPCQ